MGRAHSAICERHGSDTKLHATYPRGSWAEDYAGYAGLGVGAGDYTSLPPDAMPTIALAASVDAARLLEFRLATSDITRQDATKTVLRCQRGARSCSDEMLE